MPGTSHLGVVTRRWSSRILERLGLKRFARDMFRAIRAPGIPRVRPRIVRVLPHDPLVHTQGLAYIKGNLYESTGLVGQSTLRRLNTASGAVEDNHSVPELWAEGIAVRHDRLVQLSYTEEIAIVYRLPGLDIDGTFHYQGEGWGLAASEGGYVMSDGSHILTFRDAEFKAIRRLEVRLAKRPLEGINDLECACCKIYANVLSHNDIYEISPRTGDVLRMIDCAEIVNRARVGSSALELNGIAFAPDRNSFFITGKQWPMLFELEWAP